MPQDGTTFLNYEPMPLKFGTSGLRASAIVLTDLECYINILGFIDFLKNIAPEDGGIRDGAEIFLAGDYRPSTPRIMRAVARAITDSGCKVKNCGNVPTPAVAFCGRQNNCASIMITGSHIPEDMNGIKSYKASGEVLKSDEDKIIQHVAAARGRIYETLGTPDSLFAADGMFISDLAEPEIDQAQTENYIKRYVEVFPANCLQNKKIVVYQHSSVGRDIVTEIFKRLGAEIIIEGRTDKFVAVDTEALKDGDLKLMKEWAEKHQPFALISFDGDCDRPWLSDEHGEFISGDLLGALTSLYLKADFGAVPITCNDAVDEILSEKIKLTKTKIGSPYVIKAMMDAAVSGYKKIVGWEVNGGFLTYSDFEINNKSLSALPTRDAVLPLLCVILSAIEKNITLSEVMNVFLKRFTYSNKLPEFSNATADKIIKKYSPADENIDKLEFKADEIIIAYKNNSTETIKNDSVFFGEWQELKKTLEEKYLLPNGIEKTISLIYIDGLRIVTENKEVVHLRESNNAPELRCYAVADSIDRAKELVQIVLVKIIPELKADVE
jgi:phosphomannomutase